MTIWFIILGMAAVTYIPRVMPLIALNEESLPLWARRGLSYVPIAVLSAVIAPEFLPSEDYGQFVVDGRLLAGIVAVAVAWKTHNTALTVILGIIALVILT